MPRFIALLLLAFVLLLLIPCPAYQPASGESQDPLVTAARATEGWIPAFAGTRGESERSRIRSW
jgi:hypothetical protein